MKKIASLLPIVAALLIFSGTDVFACTCVPPSAAPLKEQVAKAVNDSEAVFSGRVISIKRSEENGNVAVKIKLDRSWKGKLSKEITVFTGLGGGGDCGFDFKTGQSYLIYTYKGDSGLETNVCLRTAILANAKEDLKLLGKGKPAVKGKV